MGYETEHSPGHLYGYSLAFTIVAALVFSITKRKSQEIPHEAIIGITYAVAVAAPNAGNTTSVATTPVASVRWFMSRPPVVVGSIIARSPPLGSGTAVAQEEGATGHRPWSSRRRSRSPSLRDLIAQGSSSRAVS